MIYILTIENKGKIKLVLQISYSKSVAWREERFVEQGLHLTSSSSKPLKELLQGPTILI